jgi:hypothetical protein
MVVRGSQAQHRISKVATTTPQGPCRSQRGLAKGRYRAAYGNLGSFHIGHMEAQLGPDLAGCRPLVRVRINYEGKLDKCDVEDGGDGLCRRAPDQAEAWGSGGRRGWSR